MTNNGAASILANENVLLRMSAPTGEVSPFPSAAWPTETFETDRKYKYLNGEAIEVLHQPRAHADMVTIVRDRVRAMVNGGMTLAQVQAANPAQGYVRRYGSASPSATRTFVESVYASLSSSRTN